MKKNKFRGWDGVKMWYEDFSILCDGTPYWTDDKIAVFFKLMQFSGLKDCEEKEIWEGDIVYLGGYGNYKVEFPFIQLYESNYEKDIGKVIGNIYENPELLK
jgi:hypothetical protein